MMPIGTPRVPYRTPAEGTWQWVDLWNALVSPYALQAYQRIYDTQVYSGDIDFSSLFVCGTLVSF